MGTNSCRGTLAIALRTRSSSAVLPASAALWALIALTAASMSRRCFSKYSAFMKRLNSSDTQICDTVPPRRHFLMVATAGVMPVVSRGKIGGVDIDYFDRGRLAGVGGQEDQRRDPAIDWK